MSFQPSEVDIELSELGSAMGIDMDRLMQRVSADVLMPNAEQIATLHETHCGMGNPIRHAGRDPRTYKFWYDWGRAVPQGAVAIMDRVRSAFIIGSIRHCGCWEAGGDE